jgi:hypothetical protein
LPTDRTSVFVDAGIPRGPKFLHRPARGGIAGDVNFSGSRAFFGIKRTLKRSIEPCRPMQQHFTQPLRKNAARAKLRGERGKRSRRGTVRRAEQTKEVSDEQMEPLLAAVLCRRIVRPIVRRRGEVIGRVVPITFRRAIEGERGAHA